METLANTHENEMISAFLMAEIESPKRREQILAILNDRGYSRSLIDSPNLADVLENEVRMTILDGIRGYQSRQFLFKGFPHDVNWQIVALEGVELKKLKYIKEDAWVDLSRGSRFVVDGAQNIDEEPTNEEIRQSVKAIAEDMRNGKKYPELIGVLSENGEIILIEGHHRATAYAITKPDRIQIIIGTSPSIKDWVWY